MFSLEVINFLAAGVGNAVRINLTVAHESVLNPIGNGSRLIMILDRAATVDTVPGQVTGLSATADGQTAIDLAWTAPNNGGQTITGYRIEVSSNGTSFTNLVADTGTTSVTYEHSGLSASTTRYYRVSAINSVGTGVPSSIANATTDSIPNQPPDADAGSNQDVDTGASVTLDGSGSNDPDGTISSYAWIQTVGTTVTLTGANTASPTFTAPSTAETLTFRLTVTDNDGATDTDDIDVVVSAVVIELEGATLLTGERTGGVSQLRIYTNVDGFVPREYLVGSFPATMTNPIGMTYNGTDFIILDSNRQLWRLPGSTITDPSTAIMTGTLSEDIFRVLTIAWDGTRYLIVDDMDNQLWSLTDITNPSSATLLGTLPSGITGFSNGSVWTGSALILNDNNTLYSVSNPNSPGSAASLGTVAFSEIKGMAWGLSSLLVLTDTGGVRQIENLSNLNDTNLVSFGGSSVNRSSLAYYEHSAISNQPPVVSISATPTTILRGGTVTLDATVTDPEGDSYTVLWDSIGRGGTFANDTSENTTYTAPSDLQNTFLQLRLTATDEHFNPGSDIVDITVLPDPSNPPTINSITATPNPVDAGGSVSLSVDITDPDMGGISYSWDDGDTLFGTFDDNTLATPTWDAPSPQNETVFTITLTATSDVSGESATGTVDVTVSAQMDIPNLAPVVTITSISPGLSIDSGDSITFTATATDDIFIHGFSVISGSPTNSGIVSGYADGRDGFIVGGTYTPPGGTPQTVNLIGAVNADTVRLGFASGNADDFPARIEITTDGLETTFNSPGALTTGNLGVQRDYTRTDGNAQSALIALEDSAAGSIRLFYDSILTVLWTSDGEGAFGTPTQLNTFWASPGLLDDTTEVNITLTVTDLEGLSGSQTRTATVRGRAPTVSGTATPTMVDPGNTVTLDVTATDPNNLALLYQWSTDPVSQGSFVDDDVIDTTWTAPTNYATNERIITLINTVTNTNNFSSTYEVDITIPGVGIPVINSVTATPMTVDGGGTIQLSSSVTDPGGYGLSYTWISIPSVGSFSSQIIANPIWTAPAATSTAFNP